MASKAVKILNLGVMGNPNGSALEGTRRFGVFELDLRAGELRRQGMKVKLQEQPFRVLAQLLEKPGQVVTRGEFRDRLWPADTFVDFDHSLNAAIRRVRDALGDSAENPTFIETVARRGYRFLPPVQSDDGNGVFPARPDALPAGRQHVWWIVAVVMAVVLVLLGLKLGLMLARRPPVLLGVSQLTATPAEDRAPTASLSQESP